MRGREFSRWSIPVRRIGTLLALSVGLLGGKLSASTILFTDTNLGGGLFRINYSLSGITFQANEALDITFPAAQFTLLQNGVAPSGFSVLLFQPNSPQGAPGVYSALALSGPVTPAGTFSVEALFTGTGSPGPQDFELDQFDSSGMFVSVVDTGTTTPAVPEPGSLPIYAVLIIAGGVAQATRRRT